MFAELYYNILFVYFLIRINFEFVNVCCEKCKEK